MNNLLLIIAGVIFLISLTVMMIRMLFARGSKLKALAYLLVYAFVLFGFSRVIDINHTSNPKPSVEELQAVELQDYLADSKNYYALGIQALESRKYLQAIELLSEVLPGDPNHKDAQAKLALARQGYAGQLLDKGRKTMSAGYFDQAVELFDQALSYDPDLVEAKKLKLDAFTRKQMAVQSQAAQDLQKAKLQMGQYAFGSGNIGLSVKKIKVTEVIPTNFGFSYTSKGDERFLWVYVSVINQGNSGVEVDPEKFYVTVSDGSRIAYSEATNSQEHLPSMTLIPGSTAGGWIIFYVPVEKQYILNYYVDRGEIGKVIVP